VHADLVNYHSSRCARIRRICKDETTIGPEAKHSTQLVPLGLTAGLIPSPSDFIGSPSDFLLLQWLLIDGRTKGALFDSLDLNGFWPGLQDWFQIWLVPAK
jgi:hypothetical protein